MREEIETAGRLLIKQLENIKFSEPVTHTYNPMDYAWDAHHEYTTRFAGNKKQVLFLGMNPGPWGMAQTGVPFGEISAVRDWMGIEMDVLQPQNPHPKRPIEGFACKKSEVSGRRLWGLFASKYPNAEDFFREHFVTNFCPLVWMGETGRNITPDKLPKSEFTPVEEACQSYLSTIIRQLKPTHLVGVGAFAEKQLKLTANKHLGDQTFQISKILHPSPASPLANKGWPDVPTQQLKDLGLW
ncbi:uracil-DNA glycosylase family protein [Rubritalea marina]|uniref:uracil-DNA glycosylase family protein n=1 Tax=Rubritalea marina TaxID=361055 RepID=UPI00037AE5F2|nr:uracil-DNA glycosylase family protein [Rubritalea marina]